MQLDTGKSTPPRRRGGSRHDARPAPRRTLTKTRLLLTMGAAAALALALASTAAAQGPMMLEAYAARTDALSNNPLFGGVAFTVYGGPLALRLNAGLHFDRNDGTNSQFGYDQRFGTRACRRFGCRDGFGRGGGDFGRQSDVGLGAWTADADLLVEPLRAAPILKSLLLGFSPYGFVGIGGYGMRASVFADTSVMTWSYGGGLHHTLLGPVGIGAEARFRQPLQNDAVATRTAVPNVWEYRVALNVSFGGRRSTPRGGQRPPPVWQPAPRRPEPRPSDVDEPDAASARLASRVLDAADGYVGTRYRAGGTSPDDGFDAAGFVRFVLGREGVQLPRTARRIAELGGRVPARLDALRPGDLVFFANDGSTIDHVAIYAGHDRIIHSSASGGGVRYDILGEGERGQWFAEHLVAARRLTGERDRGTAADELDPPDRAPRASRPPR